jgi:7-cyano-7-deazaguanine synthase
MPKKAITLVSGGLDSCVASYIAKDKGYQLFAISFRYGQRHKKELECAKKIGKKLGVKDHKIVDIDFNQFSKTTLIDSKSDKIQNHDITDIGIEIPSTYVPGRNTIFLSLALAYAESIDADTIFIGVNAVDYSGYPDCRLEYINAYQQMANLATKKGIEGKPIKIETPLLLHKKSDIIKIGLKLNIPFNDTWSCYRGKDKACGRCDSCLLRLKGFNDAKAKDPILYEYYPDWYTK